MVCYNQQMPQFNLEQFKRFVLTLNDNSLNQFVQQARARGISENDIKTGIDLINSLKKK